MKIRKKMKSSNGVIESGMASWKQSENQRKWHENKNISSIKSAKRKAASKGENLASSAKAAKWRNENEENGNQRERKSKESNGIENGESESGNRKSSKIISKIKRKQRKAKWRKHNSNGEK